MASGDGIITRKEIITDEALGFGKEYSKNVAEAIKANDELIRQFKTLLKVSGDYRKAQSNFDFKKAKDEESLLNQKILNQINQISAAEKELERIKQEKLKTEREFYRAAQENIKTSKQKEAQQRAGIKLTMEERVEQQMANKAEKQAVLEKMGLIGAYQKLNAQRTESKKRLLDLIATGNASNKQIKQAQKEFDALDKKVRKADQATGDFSKSVGNYKTAFSGLSNIMGAFGIVGGVTGMVMLGKSMYETTKQIQAQDIALKMLSSTEETYAKNKDFLRRISEQYGLELMTTTNAYKNYFASSKTAIEEGKISFEDMQLVFEKVSKSASMLGLSVENQEGAFLALSQMLSKGTVQSEELRGQLGERLPGAFEVMAKALNVTTMELGDMLKKGEVLAADVLPKFAVAYEKAIGADQINRTENLAAAQNRASNKWTEFVENLNNGQGVISSVGMGFFNLTGRVLDLIGANENLSETIFKEQLALNDLVNKITSTNITNGERLELIEKLKSSYPNFIDMIDNEDFSNKNLRRTLSLVNDEYRNRIMLQTQVENVMDAEIKRNKKMSDAASAQINLYKRLNELNVKHNLGVDLTPENAIDKVNEITNKSNDVRGFSGINAAGLKGIVAQVKTYRNEVEKLNEEVNKEREIRNDIQKSFGINTEEQRIGIKNNKDYNNQLEERLKIAVKLKGVVGKDFSEFDLTGIDNFISSKTNSSNNGGESDKERKKHEVANRKSQREAEKVQKEAEKLEKERLKKEKETYEASIDLLIWRANSEAEIYKAESINEKSTQEERYDALMESQQIEESALRLKFEKQLTLMRAFQEDKVAFTKDEINNYLTQEELLNGVNTLTDQELLILEKYYADQKKLRKDNQKDLEDNVKFEVELLKKRIQEQVKFSNSKNFNDESSEINTLSIDSNLGDVENYEKAVYDIKRKYLLKNLEDELAVYDQMIETEKAKGTVTQEMLDKQLELRNSIREFNNQSHVESLEMAKEMEQRFIEMGENIRNALVDLTNAIFDNRIQRIDEDIERTNDQYDKQQELYEGDAARQKLIREQQQRETEKLEAKKRKEQHKQAVFNKAMAVSEIGWKTAMAIMGIWADVPKVDYGISATILSIGAGILGTIQTAAVLAAPIPKYKMGRKGGPEEIAIVGDGGVHEVIEHNDGSAEITPRKDTLVKLLEGDIVHKSVDEYRKNRSKKIANNLVKDQLKMDTYLKGRNDFETVRIEKKLDDLIAITKSKNMSPIVNVAAPKIDLAHEAWRAKQLGY